MTYFPLLYLLMILGTVAFAYVMILLIEAIILFLKKRATIEVPKEWQEATDEAEEKSVDQKQPAVKEVEPLTHLTAPRKFLEVMAELKFQNPLEDFLRLTEENRVCWQISSGAPNEIVFEAKNVIDDISLRCSRSETAGTAIYALIFLDGKRRFADSFFIYLANINGDETVKKYFNWLVDKFKTEVNKTPQA